MVLQFPIIHATNYLIDDEKSSSGRVSFINARQLVSNGMMWYDNIYFFGPLAPHFCHKNRKSGTINAPSFRIRLLSRPLLDDESSASAATFASPSESSVQSGGECHLTKFSRTHPGFAACSESNIKHTMHKARCNHQISMKTKWLQNLRFHRDNSHSPWKLAYQREVENTQHQHWQYTWLYIVSRS